MTKPQSYPFLAIAKRYRLDYGDVLLVADMWRHPAARTDVERAAVERLALALVARKESDFIVLGIEAAIAKANREFKTIQAGEIDWNTGEPPRHENGMLKSIPMSFE